MNRIWNKILLPLLVLCIAVLAPAAHAQAVYGSIFGTVQDATGAVISGATVTVTDIAKGTSVNVVTNDSGEFTVEHLIPDVYNVKVGATGFKGFEQKNMQIYADTSTKVEAFLTIGAAGDTVEVNADAVPQLKTDRADVSTILGAKEIVDLPIGDRNFTNLQLLLPGAQQLGFSHAASENPQGSKQIQVDGQAFGGVAFELDGTDNQDPILGIIVINPNLDSLAETKITTQNFDAEFGKAVASVVTAQTKSGTNQFHGSAFDYRESNANLARDPFTQPSSVGFPGGLKNQFGGSIGGPILKDKVFFFADYSGVRQKVGISELQTVPSAFLVSTCLGQAVGPSGIAGCDFSEYVKAGIPIYQKSVGGAAPQPYPGNVIPTAQLSQPALNLFKLLQPFAPNAQGALNGLRQNYAASGTGGFNSNQWDVRGDTQINERMHAFGRFSRFTDTLTGTTIFGPAGGAGFGIGGYAGSSTGANDSVALGTDIVVTPKLVTDVRAGYYRYNINNQKYDAGTQFASQLGIPNENTGLPITSGAPLFNLSEVGSTTLEPNNSQGAGPQYGGGLNVTRCNCPLTEREDQFQLVNNWTKTLGNHNIKFGADLRYARNLRVPSDTDRTGNNNFGRGPTSDGQQNGGLGFATFALGEVTNYGRYVSTSTNAKEFQKRDFFYVQDTWRATQKLTVNYGLRYEVYFPETINSPGQGGILNLDTGYIQVAGIGGIGSNMNFAKPANPYSPRVGVAYQATEKTVVRAGYGRSFDIGVFGSIFGHVATQNLPILANQSVIAPGGTSSQTFAFDLANGPPNPTPIAVPANGLLPNPGYAVTSKSRPSIMRLPTLDAWNLSIQQSITPTISFTIAYVGNKGTHTLSAGDGNNTNPNEPAIFLPSQYSIAPGLALHYDPSVPADVALSTNGVVTHGISATGGTANSIYLQRYYGGKLAACADPAYTNSPAGAAAVAGLPPGACGYTNSIQYYGDNQDTHYNALQVSGAKTFSKGLSLNANYAWQRSVNFQSNFSTWDKQAAKGRDDYLREQQLIVYGLYQLPFGRDKQLFSHVSGFVNQLINGFEVSPVITYSTGLPFTLSAASCPGTPSDVPCFVNGNPRALKLHVTGTPGHGLSLFQTQPSTGGIFTVPGLDQIGNTGRNSVFGPRFFNADISLQKNVTLKEKYTVQLRVDGFNAFNHINFGNPNQNSQFDNIFQGTVGSGDAGAINSGAGVGNSANPRQLQFSGRFQF